VARDQSLGLGGVLLCRINHLQGLNRENVKRWCHCQAGYFCVDSRGELDAFGNGKIGELVANRGNQNVFEPGKFLYCLKSLQGI
jgi:hypothetical protein